jgi:opacity protein-like surface antigen
MRTHSRFGAVLVLPLLFLPVIVQAQQGFLFAPPGASLTVRGGLARPAASGELFESLFQWHTMGAGDFRAEVLGGDLMFRFADRLDVGISMDWTRSTVRSEDREYAYPPNSPTCPDCAITQTTRLRRTPVTILARAYPLPRGEAVSSYAWIPRRISPYIGGGAGVMNYRLEQEGDFVDRTTLAIFSDEFTTSSTTFAAQALAGVEVWASPRVGLRGEGRYTWASADPDYPFEFDSVDLSGWQVTAGLSLRF